MSANNTAEVVAPDHHSVTPPVTDARSTVIIDTRFGDMEFDRDSAVYLPRGLFGYADHHDFGIANLPDPRLEQFKLMQSLTDADLSFIVAPLNMDSDTIDAADIDQACEALSIARSDVAVLLIVATRKVGEETQVSVNLRAPIVVDTRSQTAWQYVLSNSRYPVRHVLSQAGKPPELDAVK